MGKADQTREFIVERTAPIFNKKGYAGTSLSDMTAATGLTKGSIYGNFGNKDEVALAAFDYNLNRMVSRMTSVIAEQRGSKNKLTAYVNMYHFLLNGQLESGGCPILNTAIDADDTHPKLRLKALSAVMSWKKGIIKILEAGMAAGEVSLSIDPDQVALTMIAMIEGAIMISKLTGDTAHWNLIMKSLTTYIEAL